MYTQPFCCVSEQRKDGYKVSKLSYDAAYLRQYRRKNPEKQDEWRTRSEIKHLESLGYQVTKVTKRKQPEQMTVEELENHIDQAKKRDREYQRKWKAKNREHLREYHRQYMKDHPEIRNKSKVSPEKRREYAARWRARHREEIREYHRNYYANNTDRIREHQAKWRAKNPHYERLRWQRYKNALAKARKEQRARIRREINAKRKGVSENDR